MYEIELLRTVTFFRSIFIPDEDGLVSVVTACAVSFITSQFGFPSFLTIALTKALSTIIYFTLFSVFINRLDRLNIISKDWNPARVSFSNLATQTTDTL